MQGKVRWTYSDRQYGRKGRRGGGNWANVGYRLNNIHRANNSSGTGEGGSRGGG